MTEAGNGGAKNAVITGGGRGIGAAVAQALAERGMGVVVSARSEGEVEAVAQELRAAGAEAHGIVADVTDPESVARLHARSLEALGQIDVLVNNAGIARSSRLEKIALEEWEQLFAVNVRGTFLCTQAFLPAMAGRGWGRVINVASVAGKAGAPYISAYAATKHAVVGFTRAIAMEYAASGVTVNAVCPGYVATALVDGALEQISAKTGLSLEEARQALEKQSPQGRIYTSEEVAFLVATLCEELSGGINGQCLLLDGGSIQA